jgi:hypothetical protein
LYARIIIYILNGLFQFCLWFQIALAVCGDAMVVPSPLKMGLDNVPSTLGLHNQFELLRFPPFKVSCLHVIFYFNGIWVEKQASSFHT